jgi:hypothetical protein
MALDTTVSGASANSYLSIADADAEFNGNPFFGTTWIAMGDAEKEFWLKFSTSALDRMYLYKGYKATAEQALQFPRKLQPYHPLRQGVVDNLTGYRMGLAFGPTEFENYFDPTKLHPYIIDALAELIPLLVREKGATDSGEIEGREEESISVLNGLVKLDYADRKAQSRLKSVSGSTVQAVKSLMRPWIRSARVVR